MTDSALRVSGGSHSRQPRSKVWRVAAASMRGFRRFCGDLIGAHLDGARAMIGLPWLFALLIGWEFAQHAIEVRIGFFDSPEAAKAVSGDSSRMVFGWIKMISVYIGGLFVIRHLALRNGTMPLAPISVALRRYAPYIAYSLILFALIFYAPGLVDKAKVMTLRTIVGLSQVVLEPLLILWIVSAATDGAVRNPIRSARATGWLYLWALPLFFVGRIPVNAAHQLLNRYAIGQPHHLLWPMLALDAVVVGLIISIIPALYVRIARFIRERRVSPSPA